MSWTAAADAVDGGYICPPCGRHPGQSTFPPLGDYTQTTEVLRSYYGAITEVLRRNCGETKEELSFRSSSVNAQEFHLQAARALFITGFPFFEAHL